MALSFGNGDIFRTLYPALHIVIRDVILWDTCPILSNICDPVVDLENSVLIRFDNGFDNVLINKPANFAILFMFKKLYIYIYIYLECVCVFERS